VAGFLFNIPKNSILHSMFDPSQADKCFLAFGELDVQG